MLYQRLLKAAKNKKGMRLSKDDVITIIDLMQFLHEFKDHIYLNMNADINDDESVLTMCQAVESSSPITCKIRYMDRQDIEEILLIEDQDGSLFWDRSKFEELLTNKTDRHGCVVAELANIIIGFIVYGFDGPNITIKNIVVEKEFRRKQVGTQLIKFLKSGYNDKLKGIITSVPEELTCVHMFLSKQGFRATAVSNDHYHFAIQQNGLKPKFNKKH